MPSFRFIENSKVVEKNTIELTCDVCEREPVKVHVKDHVTKFAPCGRDDCPSKET